MDLALGIASMIPLQRCLLCSLLLTRTQPICSAFALPNGALLASCDGAASRNTYYYHYDDLGSTLVVTNGSGTAIDSFAYDAWGNVLNTSANHMKPYQYVGRAGYYTFSAGQSVASNLLELGVRFYDPNTGRFTQRDPLTMGPHVPGGELGSNRTSRRRYE